MKKRFDLHYTAFPDNSNTSFSGHQKDIPKFIRRYSIFVFCLLACLHLSAQPQDGFYRAWAQTGSGVSSGITNHVVSIAAGSNTYSASSVSTSASNYSMHLSKLASNGSTIWTANFDLGMGGNTYVGGIGQDASGNVLVTGSAYNGSTNGQDLFLVKFNSSGTKLWHQTYNGAGNGIDFGAAVVCSTNGTVYVTGGVSQTLVNSDALTLCYSSSGSLNWSRAWDNASLLDAGGTITLSANSVLVAGVSQTNANTWEYAALQYAQSNGSLVSSAVTNQGGTNIERVSAAATDASGNIYITGALGVSGQGFNIKTIKLSPSLQILWTANWDGAAHKDDAGRSIAVDASGNVFVAGYTTASDRDGILLKYSSSGNLVFANADNAAGAGEFTGLSLTSAGDVFAGGYATLNGNKDFLALYYSSNGVLRWNETYNGYVNKDDEVQQVAPDGSGGYLLSGTSGTSTLTVKYMPHSLLIPLNEQVNAPFVENRDQLLGTDGRPADDVRYYTRSNYPNVYIMNDRACFAFAHVDTVKSSVDTMTRIDMTFGNHGQGGATVAAGLERHEDFYNYYLGHIPEGRERVPLENKVLHPNIFTNIDAMYGLGQDGFFMRLICKPGSNPSDIRMNFSGQTAISVQSNGALLVETMLEDLILAKPTAVLVDGSGNESAPGWSPAFVLNNDGSVSISVGSAPAGSSVIIKTGRGRGYGNDECDYYWSTYFGETGGERVKGNDVDADGNMYFTGYTTSNMFPILNAIQSQLIGNSDAFAACFRQLDEQKWATFYGGTDVAPLGLLERDDALAIKWNPHNNQIYFIGRTPSADFPLKQSTGYFNDQFNSTTMDSRGFIVKLNAESGVRTWATFFGDPAKRFDAVTAIHIRENGNLVVGGYGQQANNNQTAFPFFPNNTPTVMPHIQVTGGLYIAEFDMSNAQVWATKLGNEQNLGSSPALADITEDSDGQLFALGHMSKDDATDFIPTGLGSMGFSGGFDAFLIQFSLAKKLNWSTYLGGSEFDFANSVVSTQSGIIVTGTTESSNFPVVAVGDPANPLFNDLSWDGVSDIFVSEFVNNDFGGYNLFWSRFLGGPGGTSGSGDGQPMISHNGGDDGSTGNATTLLGGNEIALTGYVSTNFSPLTPSNCPFYYNNINRGVSQNGTDAVLVIINQRKIKFSTYWGGDTPAGTSADAGNTISSGVNPQQTPFVLLGGRTNSKKILNQGETIPVCRELPFPGSYYNANFLGGPDDAFISKIYYGECLLSSVTSPVDQTGALEILPNPATNIISIKWPEPGQNGANILLFDATGRVVSKITSAADAGLEVVETGNLSPGLYFVALQTSGRSYTGKFVKI